VKLAAAADKATPAWTQPLAGAVRRMKAADLDGDGKPEILVAAGPNALAYSADGRLLWTYAVNGVCHDLDAGELDPSPGKEVVVAGGDACVHLLSADGKLLRKTEVRGPAWNANFGDRPWAVYTVSVADLDGDGANEIVAGTQSFELRLYDGQLNLLKCTRDAVQHGSLDFHLVDADGDGKKEIFATDHYGFLRVLDHAGDKLFSLYTSIGDMEAVIADLDNDGAPELVYGSSTGDLHCARLPKAKPWAGNTEVIWRFDNFGYAVRRLRAADLDGDGQAEVILASQTGYVYVLAGDGTEKWRQQIGTDVVEVLVLDHGPWKLACLDRSGTLALLSGDGRARRDAHLGFEPAAGQVVDGTVVIGGDGVLAAYPIGDSAP
jgi:outer membrane protein assembly factor BamB